jgi:hypothetical protein
VTQWSAKIRNGIAPFSVHFAPRSAANFGRFGRHEVTAQKAEMVYDTNPCENASGSRSRRVRRAARPKETAAVRTPPLKTPPG